MIHEEITCKRLRVVNTGEVILVDNTLFIKCRDVRWFEKALPPVGDSKKSPGSRVYSENGTSLEDYLKIALEAFINPDKRDFRLKP